MLVVAVRVTQVVLEVADEHLGPVHDVQRAIRGHGHAGGAEVTGLGIVGLDQARLDGRALDCRTFFSELRAEDALVGNHVRVEERALPVVREVTAAEDGRARAGTRGAVPHLVIAAAGASIEVAREARSKVVSVTGGIGDDVVTPVVEHAAVRVGEAVGDVARELVGHRLEAVDGTVSVSNRSLIEGFDLGAVEHAVGEVHRTTWFIADGVCLVVGVRRVHARQNLYNRIGFFHLTGGVARKPHIGRLDEDDAILIELEASWAVEAVEEDVRLGDLASLWVEVEDEELVEVLSRRGGLGVVRPDGEPEATLGVEVHLDRVDEFRDCRLVGDELDLAALREGQVLELLFAGKVGDRLLAVRRDGDVGQEVVVLDDEVLTVGGGPDDQVAVGGLDVAIGELTADDGGVVDTFVLNAGPLTVDIELVDRAVAVVPLGGLLVNGSEERGVDGRGCLTEEGLELHGGKGFVASVIQVDTVNRQRGLGRRVELLRRGEEVDELNLVSLGNFAEGGGVGSEVLIIAGDDGRVEVGGLEVFVGNRGEEDEADLALAVVGG